MFPTYLTTLNHDVDTVDPKNANHFFKDLNVKICKQYGAPDPIVEWGPKNRGCGIEGRRDGIAIEQSSEFGPTIKLSCKKVDENTYKINPGDV